ncbi:MICOS complex subunit MIC60-like [Oppia nitens]|uniref:MICOS complex subunit MIC60-like n=1 Tax=Oppia nitens TaxID=1686743 RepID=UPI0023DB28FA|nr:MICOS complex subunit MIC60-like [Oppia nitens]
MFRSTLKLNNTVRKISRHQRNTFLRYYTTDADKSNSAKVGLIVGSSLAAFTGITIGYAKYDTDFRRKVQNLIPYSDNIFDTLFGPLIEKELKQSKENFEKSFLDKKKTRNSLNTSTAKTDNINIEKKEEINTTISQQLPQTSDLIISNDNQSETKDLNESSNEKSDNKEPEVLSSNAITDASLRELENLIKDIMDISNDEHKSSNDKDLEYQRKLAKLEEKFEIELNTQLKRQLAAYNDYLQDQLTILRQQLKRDNESKTEEKLLELRAQFQSELQNSFYRLRILEGLLKVREQLDADQHPVRELWVLAQTLKESLCHKPSLSEDSLPIALKGELTAIKSILNKQSLNDRPLIRCALEGIPQYALENGVYSREDLIKRFQKVDKYCKRVALIGDDGGNIFQYLLSYIQSVLIIGDSKIPKEELEDKEVDPTKWDTFDILSRVRYSLKNYNLEMALKYANQLRGEARNVANDWIRDTRIHLEFSQAIDLLISEADAINVQIIN